MDKETVRVKRSYPKKHPIDELPMSEVEEKDGELYITGTPYEIKNCSEAQKLSIRSLISIYKRKEGKFFFYKTSTEEGIKILRVWRVPYSMRKYTRRPKKMYKNGKK